jgi:hypothetical protein
MSEIEAIERLNWLEEIYLLKARRDRAADSKDWALYESLHASDHHSFNDDYPPTKTAAEMIATMRRAMQNLTTLHHSHTPEISFASSSSASGIWAMKGLSVWSQDGVSHWFVAFGHYFETYERCEDQWLFKSRRLKYSHTMTSPGAVFPPKIDPTTPDQGNHFEEAR